MPFKAKKPCTYPGCPELVSEGRYCSEHAAEYEARRGSSHQRGYGAHWQRLRAMYLRRHPVCVDPFEAHAGQVITASEVDHVLPKSRGGTDAWDNLQALCKSCHSRKTSQEGRWG